MHALLAACLENNNTVIEPNAHSRLNFVALIQGANSSPKERYVLVFPVSHDLSPQVDCTRRDRRVRSKVFVTHPLSAKGAQEGGQDVTFDGPSLP